MTNMNMTGCATIDRHASLGFKIGCVVVMVVASANSATAQVVAAAGEKPDAVLGAPARLIANETTRVSSRRMLILVPQGPSASTRDTSPPAQEVGEMNDTTGQSRGIIPAQLEDLEIEVETVNLSTAPIGTGTLPPDVAAKRAPPSSHLMDGQARGFPVQQVNWAPANICHLPLYFEDAMLERHGHVRWGCAQPIVSGARFLTTIPLLPYLATLQPKCEPRYTLGHFRAGSCAPALKDHLPWDRRAAVVETASLGAFFWAMPL